jgi:hypothetical protein
MLAVRAHDLPDMAYMEMAEPPHTGAVPAKVGKQASEEFAVETR